MKTPLFHKIQCKRSSAYQVWISFILAMSLGIGGCKSSETNTDTGNSSTSETEMEEPSTEINCAHAKDVTMEELYYDRAATLCQDSIAEKGIRLVGDLTITGITETSLEKLSCFCAVTGNLQIYDNENLLDLHGLEHLRSVNGNLLIGGKILANGGLLEEGSPGNPSLESLHGLKRLTSVGDPKYSRHGLIIYNNDRLTNLEGLDAISAIYKELRISGNDGLTNLRGLPSSFTSVYNLTIENNDGLINLEGLDAISSIESKLEISGNDELTSLKGLSTDLNRVNNLVLSDNAQVLNLTDLRSISSMGSLMIVQSNGLTSLEGLDHLSSLGRLVILENDKLTSLAGLSPELHSLSLDADMYGGILFISGNDMLANLEGLGFISSIDQKIVIVKNSGLMSLQGLSPQLTSVPDGITISDNDALTSLKGLEAISELGDMYIEGNGMLTSLEGLSPDMTAITRNGNHLYGGKLSIIDNDALVDLTGLPASLAVIEDALAIAGNDVLISLGNLSQLTTVNTIIIADNPLLITVGGLGTSLTSIGEEYKVICNPMLSEEEAKKVIQNLVEPLPAESIIIDTDLCVDTP